MATEQQIEAVAIAIRKAFEQRTKRPKLRPWHKLPEDVRVAFRFEATAAIDAYDAILRTQK